MNATRLPTERGALPPSLVIVFGPPLPGRSGLARALEKRLGHAERLHTSAGFPHERVIALVRDGTIPIVEGDYPRAAERAELLGLMRSAGMRSYFVAWLCDPAEASREIYRRYASLPRRYADHWWRIYEADEAIREAPGPEIPPDRLVTVGAGGSLMDQVVRVAAALGLPGAAPPHASARKRILVVDDDEDQRAAVGAVLEELGCEVSLAESAARALEMVEGCSLDLVISDQQMPGVRGTDLAAELARLRPELPVALLTGYADEALDDALTTPAVRLLLAKPVRIADLIRLIEELDLHE